MVIKQWATAAGLGFLLVVLAGPLLAQTAHQASTDQALALYLAVSTGKRSMQSLTPEQQREVQIVAAMMARPRYTSQKCQALADAEDELQDARDQLQSCLASAGADDDCSTEMDQVNSAKSDYEDAQDDAEDDCQ